MKGVVVTGIGLLSPFGAGEAVLVRALLEGRSALGNHPGFPGGVAGLVPGAVAAPWVGKARRLATRAARAAIGEAGLPPEARREAGLVLGTIVGEALAGTACQRRGMGEGRRQRLLQTWSWGTLARRTAAKLGLGGCAVPVSTACCSGADAIGIAAREISAGRAEVMIAGGVETLNLFQWSGFRRLGALDPGAVRPFDRSRRGTGLGEGACFWVLEEETVAARRGRPFLGRVRGWATAADGHSLTAPDPRGGGLLRAARGALQEAGIGSDALALIVAHGTGTPPNDRSEAAVLQALLGEGLNRVAVTAVKGATGHCLGASAALEASVALWCLRERRVPGVVGLREPDPELALKPLQRVAGLASGEWALTLASGFGGQNAALVLEGVAP